MPLYLTPEDESALEKLRQRSACNGFKVIDGENPLTLECLVCSKKYQPEYCPQGLESDCPSGCHRTWIEPEPPGSKKGSRRRTPDTPMMAVPASTHVDHERSKRKTIRRDLPRRATGDTAGAPMGNKAQKPGHDVRPPSAPLLVFESRLYNVKEAAAVLRLDVSTIRGWIQQHKLRALRVGGRNLVIWGHELEKMVGDAYKWDSRGDE